MDRQQLNRLIDNYALAYGCDYALWKATGIWDHSSTSRALAILDSYIDEALYSREEAVTDCLNNFPTFADCQEGIYENET